MKLMRSLAVATLAILPHVQAETVRVTVSATATSTAATTTTTPPEVVKQFTSLHAEVLDHPFVGDLKKIFATQPMGAEWVEAIRLNFLAPTNPGEGFYRNHTPFLALTSDQGKSHDAGFGLRTAWPSAEDLAELTQAKSYAALVKLLGPPTHVGKRSAIVGIEKGKDFGIYHRIWWKLFRPVDADTIEIFDLTVDRVAQHSKGVFHFDKEDEVTITALQIRLGTLKREK
jgi:hypothetical protein